MTLQKNLSEVDPVLLDIVSVHSTQQSFEKAEKAPIRIKRDYSQQVIVTHANFLKSYELKQNLGKGAFGKVVLAVHKLT
jgi:serine/threonine protein kinase